VSLLVRVGEWAGGRKFFGWDGPGVIPAFTAAEIYDDFDRYIKLYQEIFGVQ
jgi:hypothetical protein